MSRLELAEKRLDSALESLEAAAGTRGADPAPDAHLAALEAERQMLLARVAELEEELAALSGASEEIEGRLDGAIGEIRAALAR